MDLDTTQHSDVISFPSTPTIRQLKDVKPQYIDDFDCLTDSEMRHVIPRVYDKNAKARGSKSTWTKAPGRLRDKNGDLVRRAVEIRGYTDWTKRLYSEYPKEMTDEQRARFDEESELIKEHAGDWAFGFMLGENYVAIDCDLEDTDKSEQVLDTLTEVIGKPFPIRSRGGARWLGVFHVKDGDAEQYGKNGLSVKCNGGHDVEIFTKDSHVVISGKHPDGGDYAWYCEPFGTFHEITMEQLLSFREKVKSLFGVAESPFKKRYAREFKGDPCNLKAFCGEDKDFKSLFESFLDSAYVRDARADYLRESEWFIDEDDEKIYLRCMNEAEHSTHTGVKQTCYFKSSGGFKCFHSHCENITREQFEAYYFKKAPKTTLEQLVTDCTRCAVIKNGKDHIWLSHFNPSAQAVAIVLRDTDLIGFELRYDSFGTREQIRFTNKDIYARFYKALSLKDDKMCDWCDVDVGAMDSQLKAHLGSMGFVDGRVSYYDALKNEARAHTFDSLLERLDALPDWDGVQRIDTFFQDYVTEIDAVPGQSADYLKTVSRYLWTSLVGRATCTDPTGIKVDTSIILTGWQGRNKSTFAKAIALGFFMDGFSFEASDKDQKQLLHESHAIIIEVAEMAGYRKKDNESLKSFLSSSFDTYRPCYGRVTETHPRRNIFIMTTNDDDFCKDETGNRRYAPIKVTRLIDAKTLEREVEQLWAEALIMFKEHGVMWQGLDEMTSRVNKSYEDVDSWSDDIADCVERLGESFTYKQIYGRLGIDIQHRDGKTDRRVRKILIQLGYEFKTMWVKDRNTTEKRWVKKT